MSQLAPIKSGIIAANPSVSFLQTLQNITLNQSDIVDSPNGRTTISTLNTDWHSIV